MEIERGKDERERKDPYYGVALAACSTTTTSTDAALSVCNC